MGKGIIVILAFGAIVLMTYSCRVLYHINRLKPTAPGLTIQEAWDYWWYNKDQLSETNQRIVDLVQRKFDPSAIEKIREELYEIEEVSNKAAEPLIPLRKAIMDAVDTSFINEAILNLDEKVKKKIQNTLGDQFSDDMLVWGYLTGNIMSGILRWYSWQKYGDASEDDWYTCYIEVSKENANNTAQMLKEHAANEGAQFHAILYKPWKQAMEQLREKLLKVPIQTPVPKSTNEE